jgi:S1-C subfamily serine protease
MPTLKSRGSAAKLWLRWMALSVSFVGPTLANGQSHYPSGISHGFGAAFSSATEEQTSSIAGDNAEQQLAPGQIVIEVDPSLVTHTARWEEEPARDDRPDVLARVSRSLQTVTELRDGNIVGGNGSGFAFGDYLITALHILQGPDYDGVVNHYAMMNGRPVQATTTYPEVDIAVIETPAARCDNCEPLTFAGLHDVFPDQPVNWLYRDQNEVEKRQARIVGFATLAADTDNDDQSGCTDNLVVLVDLPFEQGTSGGPVVDAQSGKILGIIQGTLNETTLASGVKDPGFFKPIACIAALADLASNHSDKQ